MDPDATGDALAERLVAFRPTGQARPRPTWAIAKDRGQPGCAPDLAPAPVGIERAEPPIEQATLARWASWGAVPEVFDEANPRFASTRAELHTLLSEKEWAAARRTTINAHYTSAEVVQAVWSVVADLGFAGGRVLEPGCGSGNFIGFAPPGLCDHRGRARPGDRRASPPPSTPRPTIRAESFADTALPDGDMDLVIGNVPFGKITLHDPAHNAGRHRSTTTSS